MKMNWMYLLMMSLAALDGVPLDPPPESPIPHSSPDHSVRLDSLAPNSSDSVVPSSDSSRPRLPTDHSVRPDSLASELSVKRASVEEDEEEKSAFWSSAWNFIRRFSFGYTLLIDHPYESSRSRLPSGQSVDSTPLVRRVKRASVEEDEPEKPGFWSGVWDAISSLGAPRYCSDPEREQAEESRQRAEGYRRFLRSEFNLPYSNESILVNGRPGVAPFDPVLANDLFQLASAAYGTRQDACVNWISKSAGMIMNLTWVCDFKQDSCHAYMAFFPESKAIVLVFRGTLVIDHRYYYESYIGREAPFDAPSGGKASIYAAEGFARLWKNGVEKALARQLVMHPEYSLWITGHYIGGSMATIAAAFIGSKGAWPAEKIISISFGEPRTGDYEFALGLSKMRLAAYRVYNRDDFIYKVYPKHSWLSFPKGAPHLNYFFPEVFYDNSMSDINDFVLCKSKKEGRCSEKYDDWYPSWDQVNHQQPYYGTNAIKYGQSGCYNYEFYDE